MNAHPVALYGFITTVVVVAALTVLAALGKIDGTTVVGIIGAIGGGSVGVAGGVTVPGKHAAITQKDTSA